MCWPLLAVGRRSLQDGWGSYRAPVSLQTHQHDLRARLQTFPTKQVVLRGMFTHIRLAVYGVPIAEPIMQVPRAGCVVCSLSAVLQPLSSGLH